MKNIKFIINALLLMTISIACGANAFGQAEEILVEGNPPLTRRNVDGVIKYYERGLAVTFTEYERDLLQGKLIETWQKAQNGNAKNLEGFIDTVEKINRWDDAKVKAHQREITETLLADLKSSPRNLFYQYVLRVYRNLNGDITNPAKQTDANNSYQTETDSSEISRVKSENSNEQSSEKNEKKTSDKPNFQPVTGAIKMSDLVGKWNKGTVASYGYRNSVTNDYKSGYGSANMHEIRANGSFDYANYAQISLYGCTTELSTSMKGRAAISGSQVTFNYISGNVKGKDSCKSEGFDKPAHIKNSTYQLERDGDRLRLCEVGAKSENCLYKEEK